MTTGNTVDGDSPLAWTAKHLSEQRPPGTLVVIADLSRQQPICVSLPFQVPANNRKGNGAPLKLGFLIYGEPFTVLGAIHVRTV